MVICHAHAWKGARDARGNAHSGRSGAVEAPFWPRFLDSRMRYVYSPCVLMGFTHSCVLTARQYFSPTYNCSGNTGINQSINRCFSHHGCSWVLLTRVGSRYYGTNTKELRNALTLAGSYSRRRGGPLRPSGSAVNYQSPGSGAPHPCSSRRTQGRPPPAEEKASSPTPEAAQPGPGPKRLPPRIGICPVAGL